MNTSELLDAYSPLEPGDTDLESLLPTDDDPPLDRQTLDAWFRLYERWDVISAFDDVPYALRELIAAHPEGMDATRASLQRTPTVFAATVLDDLHARRGDDPHAAVFDDTVVLLRTLLASPLHNAVARALLGFAERRPTPVALPEPAPWPALPAGLPNLGEAAGTLWGSPLFRRLGSLVSLRCACGEDRLMVSGPHGLNLSFEDGKRASELELPAAWGAVWPLGLDPSQTSDQVEARLGPPIKKNKIASQWVLPGNKVLLARFRGGVFQDVLMRWVADASDLPAPPPSPPEVALEQIIEELGTLGRDDEARERLYVLYQASAVHGCDAQLAQAWVAFAERTSTVDVREALHALEAMDTVGAEAARASLGRRPNHTALFMARRALNAESDVDAWTAAVKQARMLEPELVADLDDLLELP